MNIVIVGAGTVGAAICAQLAKEAHDITIVDTDASALTELSNTADVFGVVGNGADVSVLRKAGAEHADLLIAVTSGDEINILCCAAARKLGTGHTVARVRNPEYSELMSLMQRDMNLSLTINPELAAAKEIYRLLRFPSVAKIDTFCHGRVELAEFTVPADSPLAGATLTALRNRLNIKFLVCSVLRDGVAHIPSGDFEIRAGDVVCVTAPDAEITRFFKAVNMYRRPVRDVLLVGGGRTTYYLEELLEAGGIRSTVIERDPALCRELAEAYSCTVVCDSGTKQERLLEEGIEQADAFLALSEVDEENAIMSMYAKTRHVPKVVTMIKGLSYADFFAGAGLDSIVSPKSSTATYILRFVRSMAGATDADIESLHRMMDGQVEALEFLINQPIEGLTDVPLRSLHSRAGVLVACIMRGDEILIPSGNDSILAGDRVIVITTVGQMKNVKDILKQ